MRPGMNPGDNPYHFVVVHVDGARVWLEVIGVDWGRGFQPYKSARAGLGRGQASPLGELGSNDPFWRGLRPLR